MPSSSKPEPRTARLGPAAPCAAHPVASARARAPARHATEAHEDPDEDDEDDTKETEKELDERMKTFEELMDRRPFLVNDVLLRRNPNDVQEWEKRIALWGNDDEKVSSVD